MNDDARENDSVTGRALGNIALTSGSILAAGVGIHLTAKTLGAGVNLVKKGASKTKNAVSNVARNFKAKQDLKYAKKYAEQIVADNADNFEPKQIKNNVKDYVKRHSKQNKENIELLNATDDLTSLLAPGSDISVVQTSLLEHKEDGSIGNMAPEKILYDTNDASSQTPVSKQTPVTVLEGQIDMLDAIGNNANNNASNIIKGGEQTDMFGAIDSQIVTQPKKPKSTPVTTLEGQTDMFDAIDNNTSDIIKEGEQINMLGAIDSQIAARSKPVIKANPNAYQTPIGPRQPTSTPITYSSNRSDNHDFVQMAASLGKPRTSTANPRTRNTEAYAGKGLGFNQNSVGNIISEVMSNTRRTSQPIDYTKPGRINTGYSSIPTAPGGGSKFFK